MVLVKNPKKPIEEDEDDFDLEDEEDDEEKDRKVVQSIKSSLVPKQESKPQPRKTKIVPVDIPTQTVRGWQLPDGTILTDVEDKLLFIAEKLQNIEGAVC